MAPGKIKRAATIAVASSCLLLCVAGTSAAQPADSEAAATEDEGASTESIVEKKPRLNSIRLSGVYVFQILKERSSQATGERLETRESFGGFEIAYQRDLIEEHLAIELASVFVFSADTFEAPFKVTLQGLFVKGPWEGYIGPVLGYNIRVFNTERAREEGRNTIVSFGVGATIGGSYHFTERWGLELGFDYAFGVADPVVAHDFGFALGGVYYF